MPLDGIEAKGHAAPFSVIVSGGKRLGSEWVTVESAGFSRLNTVFSWRTTIFSHISSGTICDYETHTVIPSAVTSTPQAAHPRPCSRR